MPAGIQTQNGKAFEYACVNALYRRYSGTQNVQIINSDAMETARHYFKTTKMQNLSIAADAAIRSIEKLEPRLPYPENDEPLYLSIQADAHGIEGDVRDVLCARRGNNWQIGFSCKHNHHAVKHSRLSGTIDFGEEWFGTPCSQQYFDEVRPKFHQLAQYRDEARAHNTVFLWKDVPGKYDDYYIPVLQSFMDELKRISAEHPDTPAKLIHYLIGTYDFYKITTEDATRCTRIEVMNISGTLNQPAGGHQPVTYVPQLQLPTCFYFVGFKPESNNTILVACDNGWQISMRLHSAKSEVEPSLKFDVNLMSTPKSIHSSVEPWDT